MTENKSQIYIIDPFIKNDLGNYELANGEYAPKTVSRIESLIYEWPLHTIFEQRVYIRELAEFLHNSLLDERVKVGPVIYLRDDGKEECYEEQ